MMFEIIGSASRYTNPEVIKVKGTAKRACEIARRRTARRWFTASVYRLYGKGLREFNAVAHYINGRKVRDA